MKAFYLLLSSLSFFLVSCSSIMLAQDPPQQVNQVSSKVLRSFNKMYGEVPTAKWVRTSTGYAVSFSRTEINTLVHYARNGTRVSWLLSYGEDQLSPAIRRLVKSSFYDYTITHVSELHSNDAMVYHVLLEDKTTIKTIKISEGEWEIENTMYKLQ